jgi:hypothetical protein
MDRDGGIPILNADKAKNVIVIKRGQGLESIAYFQSPELPGLHPPIRLPHHARFIFFQDGSALAPLAAFETLPGTGGHSLLRLLGRACGD